MQDVTIRFVLQDLPVITSRAQSQGSLHVRQDVLLGAKPMGGAVENCAVARTDDVETVYKWRQRTQEVEQWRHALDVDALKVHTSTETGKEAGSQHPSCRVVP